MRVAGGIDEGDLRGPLSALAEDAPARFFPDDFELRRIRRDDVCAALHDTQPVVKRIAELRDVEIRDVSNDERHYGNLTSLRGS
jgi:hypothetical protein